MTDGFVAQTSFAQSHVEGFEGMIADSSPVHIVSGLSCARQLVSVAYSVANTTAYTVTINGHAYLYTSDGSATDAEIATGLLAAINGGTDPVVATGAATPILVESTLDGDAGAFTISGTNTTPSTLVSQGSAIGFGKFVCMDERRSASQAVRLPRQASDVTGLLGFGVAVADNYAKVANGALFKGDVEIPVMRKGHIYVVVEENVSKGDQPYVRYAAGATSNLGAFRKSVDSSSAAALPRAVYLETATAGNLCKVELNFV